MIFKCASLVQILTLDDFMWASFPCPAIRPFVHILVRFLLMLSINTFNVNDDIVFRCVMLLQILLFVVLMSDYLPFSAIRPFVHSSGY